MIPKTQIIFVTNIGYHVPTDDIFQLLRTPTIAKGTMRNQTDLVPALHRFMLYQASRPFGIISAHPF